jgi:hypothetical protein
MRITILKNGTKKWQAESPAPKPICNAGFLRHPAKPAMMNLLPRYGLIVAFSAHSE